MWMGFVYLYRSTCMINNFPKLFNCFRNKSRMPDYEEAMNINYFCPDFKIHNYSDSGANINCELIENKISG